MMRTQDGFHLNEAFPRRELISHATVGILALWLLGMGVGTKLPPTFGAISIGAGLIGLLAFGVFEYRAREKQRWLSAQAKAILERRLERNVIFDRTITLGALHHRPSDAHLAVPSGLGAELSEARV